MNKIDLGLNREFAMKAEGKKLLNNGNHQLYKCPAGKWTIGYGYNLEDHGLPEDMAKELLRRMLASSEIELSKNLGFWDRLDFTRKAVLVDMIYNMGWPTLSKFKNMFAALKADNFNKAAEEMKDSKWYKQVGFRSKKLNESMRTGEWNEY
jgi:lysozyme